MKVFQISVFEDHERLSRHAAKWLLRHVDQAIAARGRCVLVPSAGRTPERIYEILRERHRFSIDWSRVIALQMDEYAEMPNVAPNSFACYLHEKVISPLGIGTFWPFFDTIGRPRLTIAGIDQEIEALGGIDVVLYGIGENGHLGFNEPGADESSSTGYVRLSDTTLAANTGLPAECARSLLPERGITLGLRTLLRGRKSLLVASGRRKQAAVSRFVAGAISPDSPSTYLRTREGVSIMLTDDCAPFRSRLSNYIDATPSLSAVA